LALHLLQQAKYSACSGNPVNNALAHNYALAAVSSIGVRDGVEALLAVQMVSVHSLTMQYLANAAGEAQPDVVVEMHLNRANRLLRTFTTQMEALTKYRSRGVQHVTVEHVNVHSGGQAVVGSVPLDRGRSEVSPGQGVGDE
jgi:hypothetical protein